MLVELFLQLSVFCFCKQGEKKPKKKKKKKKPNGFPVGGTATAADSSTQHSGAFMCYKKLI
jgi:hypothetical protein